MVWCSGPGRAGFQRSQTGSLQPNGLHLNWLVAYEIQLNDKLVVYNIFSPNLIHRFILYSLLTIRPYQLDILPELGSICKGKWTRS